MRTRSAKEKVMQLKFTRAGAIVQAFGVGFHHSEVIAEMIEYAQTLPRHDYLIVVAKLCGVTVWVTDESNALLVLRDLHRARVGHLECKAVGPHPEAKLSGFEHEADEELATLEFWLNWREAHSQ